MAIFSTLQQLTAHTPGHLHPPNMEKSCSKSPPTTWQCLSDRRPHPFLSAAPQLTQHFMCKIGQGSCTHTEWGTATKHGELLTGKTYN